MNRDYFATVARGLESIATQELAKLGAEEIRPAFAGVHFRGDKTLLYRVNLWSRIVFRILMPISKVKCYDAKQLYKNVQEINWEEYLQPENTLAVNCTGGNQNLNHTHFTALQIKNAIVDQQQQNQGQRSSVDTINPDLLINAHIDQNYCILSLDSSGTSLHRRGYRPAVGFAPLKETLAAALLEMAEWEPSLPFLDPMCGSGTLLLEATLKSLNIAPGLYRQQFAFERWRDFDSSLWQQLLQQAKSQQLSALKAPIIGCDCDAEIMQQAQINAEYCGVSHHLKLIQTELAQLQAPAECGIIICNPPYGKRVGEVQQLESLYQLLGDVLKQRFKGWTAYILTGNKDLGKKIGLRASRRLPVYNGSLPCTLLKYELY